jgi:hypothetical protein
MAFDTENARVAALAAGLGGDLMGLMPWAAAGFQNGDATVLLGAGGILADTVPPSGGAPGATEQYDILRRRRKNLTNSTYQRKRGDL